MGVAAFFSHRATDPLTSEQVHTLSRSDVNPLDRGATWQFSERAGRASDYLVYGLITAPPAMLFDRTVRNDWQTFSLMYGETLLLTGAVVQLVKGVVARTRPYAYNEAVPLEAKISVDARRSFYSSHTAVAFTSAVFLSITYSAYFPQSPWKPWVWAISLATASTVGYLRFAAGEHFPTDILTGAAVGAAIGYLVPAFHEVGRDDISVLAGAGYRSASVAVVVWL